MASWKAWFARTQSLGTNETRPSAASRLKASRTGVREPPDRSESCSCRNTGPGASSPETIASSMSPAMSSPWWIRASRQAVVGDERRELRQLVAERDLGEDILRLRSGLHPVDLLAHARLVEAAVA